MQDDPIRIASHQFVSDDGRVTGTGVICVADTQSNEEAEPRVIWQSALPEQVEAGTAMGAEEAWAAADAVAEVLNDLGRRVRLWSVTATPGTPTLATTPTYTDYELALEGAAEITGRSLTRDLTPEAYQDFETYALKATWEEVLEYARVHAREYVQVTPVSINPAIHEIADEALT